MKLFRILALSMVCVASMLTTTAKAQSNEKRSELLVTTDWLAKHLNDPNLVLLHLGKKSEYTDGHIPGAIYIDLDDIADSDMDKPGGLMLQMPPADALRQKLERLGISDNSKVVVYYGNDWITPATRVMFTLDYAGLGAQSSLLDGGMQLWKSQGHSLQTQNAQPRKGSLSPLKVRSIVVDADFVKNNVGKPGLSVVDARAAAFYDGVQAGGGMSGQQRKGHIAGARSLPFTEITDAKLLIKSQAQLADLFLKAGVKPGDTVVGYCHIGQQATGMLFAARLLGHKVMLYDGSFEDWSARSTYPVSSAPAK